MRKSCIECTLKHLAQAAVLMEEAELGYPLHKWLAIGHLAEASAECITSHAALAHTIRDARKLYIQDEEINIMDLIIDAEGYLMTLLPYNQNCLNLTDYCNLSDKEELLCESCKNYVDQNDSIKPQPKIEDFPTTATKLDIQKIRLDLLSAPALVGLGKVLTFGCKKYGANNWRKGFKWSRLIAAAGRHWLAFMAGEDLDPETGLPHIDHLACCVMFLSEHQKAGLGLDDRHVVDTGSMTYE